MPPSLLRRFPPALAMAALFAAASAQTPLDHEDAPGRGGPPVHVAEFGRYTLRANAVPSRLLPESTTERHGIERAAGRGVLNVVVLERRGERQVTVPAQVTATKDNLLGQTEAVAMRPIEENGRVSYLGTFDFAPLRNLRFVLSVRPAGSGEPLAIEFEDRFTPHGP